MTLPPDLQAKYGRDKDYREWGKQMPAVPFRGDWEVTILPPFGGAAARFRVKRGDVYVSVYADFDNSLGCYWDSDQKPLPYWEIYPFNDDVWRCDLANTEELCEHIEMSLKEQTNPPTPSQEAKQIEILTSYDLPKYRDHISIEEAKEILKQLKAVEDSE